MTSADQDFGSQRRRGDGRRGPAHARTSPRWPDAGPPAYQADYYQADYYQPERYQPQPEFPGWAGQPAYQDEYSGWTEQPGYKGEYPDSGWTGQPAPQAEYPGWTGQPAPKAEYPGWTGQHQVEYPGEPGQYGQYALHPDHPSWPESRFAPWPGQAPVVDRRPSGVAVAPPLPERVRPPFTPQPDFPPRADAPPHVLAPRRDIPLHRDMDPAPVMQDTITDVANWAQPDVAYAQPAREQIWDAGASQLADWIIQDANQQAAEITREARNQASSSLADAQQEAAELVRRTGEQAALTIEAAELQAAGIRATMMKLTTELTGMAAYVTQNLTPAPPATAPSTPAPSAFSPPAPKRPAQPAASLAPEPVAGPRPGPSARPAVPPRARPTAAPTARPAGQPSAKSRQHAAVRVMTVFTAAMVLFALTAGASEVALHGFKFFVFRSAGTGETGRNGGLQENQGPGQPAVPGAHQLQKP
jgi:hypothetical protein